jgi:hypothetical protein
MRQVTARLLLLAVAVPQAATGAWALFAPRRWFDGFPGAGHVWVAPLGPYDEHLVVDVGSALLALSVLAAWGAIVRAPALRAAAAATLLIFSVPHLVYHSANGGLNATEGALNLTSLALAVALPAAALLLTTVPIRSVPVGRVSATGAVL